jgi:hypothetical protein
VGLSGASCGVPLLIDIFFGSELKGSKWRLKNDSDPQRHTVVESSHKENVFHLARVG